MPLTQEYVQLKTELNNCIKVRNTLNTFMITTFVAVLALAYNYVREQPYIFLGAQILMIPVLVRILDYKKTEFRLSKIIQETFGTYLSTQWEEARGSKRAFYFEFLTLSGIVSLGLSLACYYNVTLRSSGLAFGSWVVTIIIVFLTCIGYKLATKNCEDGWFTMFRELFKPKSQVEKQ